VGYILLGLVIKTLDVNFDILHEEGIRIFEFLAKLGIFTLLFKIGLDTDVKGLISSLKNASYIWIINIVLSFAAGYAASFWLLGFTEIQSAFIGIALTATSVGISLAPWKERNKLDTQQGRTMLDVAELDDISSIMLMALLFSVAPALKQGSIPAGEILFKATIMLGKLLLFGGFCVMLSLFLEKRLTRFFEKIEKGPDPMITIAGIGIVLAATAGLLGFSLAIGAFFAGLIFSRDPDVVRMEASFDSIYEFFTPFFFIGIGLSIAPGSICNGLIFGLILFAAAVVGKLIGAGGPVVFTSGVSGLLLLGTSMIPRAEIAMIVMQRGLHIGDWAVTDKAFSAMALVIALSCILAPIAVKYMLSKYLSNNND
jgi:Kef-type K+ transport system membrane component KefB